MHPGGIKINSISLQWYAWMKIHTFSLGTVWVAIILFLVWLLLWWTSSLWRYNNIIANTDYDTLSLGGRSAVICWIRHPSYPGAVPRGSTQHLSQLSLTWLTDHLWTHHVTTFGNPWPLSESFVLVEMGPLNWRTFTTFTRGNDIIYHYSFDLFFFFARIMKHI